MNKIKRLSALCLGATMLISCSVKQAVKNDIAAPKEPIVQAEYASITLATWNVEHLAFPVDTGCKPRTTQELEQLKAYAKSLNTDVVALQEVASAQAVAQLFPPDQWQIIMSSRPDSESYECRGSGRASTQQKLAFAVKKSINISGVSPISDLGLNRLGLRYGLEIQLDAEFGSLTLLNVHLKSGCFVDNYLTSDRQSCEVLSRQVPVLDNWIGEKEKSGKPYAVLGDFNHRLSAPYNQFTQQIVSSTSGGRRSIVNASGHLIGCHPRYPAPIDHVFVGNLKGTSYKYETEIHHFEDMNAEAMLSDHCAVVTRLNATKGDLSSAVKWQTTSKEYQLLTRGIYHQAEARLSTMALPSEPWVVVMDVDETVLDNSAYQVVLGQTGTRYSPQTWDTWIMSQQATLVPGVSRFIQKVFAMGGKVALVTNREKVRDQATWQNLTKLLSLTFENTCLVGRNQQDIDAINGLDIINDKDLRRQQLRSGDIDCFSSGEKQPAWQSAHTIVMHIGDNIEDIEGITQHDANIEELDAQWNTEFFILPNPMYGSW